MDGLVARRQQPGPAVHRQHFLAHRDGTAVAGGADFGVVCVTISNVLCVASSVRWFWIACVAGVSVDIDGGV